MKDILACTKAEDIKIEALHNGCVKIYLGKHITKTLHTGDVLQIEGAYFTKVPVPEEIYWKVRATEALGGIF
jgi:hypothetical protein